MKNVTVLRGGPSSEYDVSMRSGQAVTKALEQLKYPFKDIVVTKQGEWLHNGFVRNPDSILDSTDVVFLALHGEYGEDGSVQRILQRKNIPFTGSRAMSSSVAFNKELAKTTLRSQGINMPRHRKICQHEIYSIDKEIDRINSDLGLELFLKPITGGSSNGAKYVRDQHSLKEALEELLSLHRSVMVEEFIRGKEATVGVIDNFRGESLYVLPIIEIIPPIGDDYFTTENKYNGKTQEIVPGRFSYDERAQLAELAIQAHQAINCDHYSRSDFIVRNGKVYFLELNTLPGLTEESLFPKAAAAVGMNFNGLVQHLVETASR